MHYQFIDEAVENLKAVIAEAVKITKNSPPGYGSTSKMNEYN
jgi:threonine aldolase